MKYLICKENFNRTIYDIDSKYKTVEKRTDVKFIKNNKYKITDQKFFCSEKIIILEVNDINGNIHPCSFSADPNTKLFEYYKNFFYEEYNTVFENVKSKLDDIPLNIIEQYLRVRKLENIVLNGD